MNSSGNMKKERKIANAKLGALVLASMIFLVFSLYFIGKNQNIFGSSIRVIAEMKNVNGLLPGNNIRFKGMDVGTADEYVTEQPSQKLFFRLDLNQSENHKIT